MNKEQILIEGISKIAKEVISFTSSKTNNIMNPNKIIKNWSETSTGFTCTIQYTKNWTEK